MNNRARLKYRGFNILKVIAALAITLWSQPSFSCSCSADPWFSENISIDTSTLPDVLKAVVHSEGWIEFTNPSDTPVLFPLTRKEGASDYRCSKKSIPESGVPVGWCPGTKLVNGRLYTFISDDVKIFKQEAGRNVRLSGWVDGGGVGPYTKTNFGESQRWGDDRPSYVAPPLNEEFAIDVFYEGEPKVIRGQISYGINSHYNPKGASNCLAHCQAIQRGFGLVIVALVLAVAAAAGVILYSVYRRVNRYLKKPS